MGIIYDVNTPLSNLERGFIDKNKVLRDKGESEIFKLVFGFSVYEDLCVKSPFRKDNNPGCTFKMYNGTLWFVDFANHQMINGIKMCSINCFHAVQIYYNLPTFYHTLKFIEDNIHVSPENNLEYIFTTTSKRKYKKKIEIEEKEFTDSDSRYWLKFGITKSQLKKDCVSSVNRYKIASKEDDLIFRPKSLCYSYNGFKGGRKKIYQPYNTRYKFTSTCKSNDIGELGHLINKADQLIISKSYKDARVLRNRGLNCIWFQNEGMVPSKDILKNLCHRFSKIVVFFDNDRAGKEASIKVKNRINKISPDKATTLHLPENSGAKDPSDLYRYKGVRELNEFINKKLR